MAYDPDAPAIEAMLAGLRERQYVVLQQLTAMKATPPSRSC
ncbi:hypothetical protein [Streptomyces sp. NPDC047141]